MFIIDDITNENNEDHDKKWPDISDHPYRMLIPGGSGSVKTNALPNLKTGKDNDSLNSEI